MCNANARADCLFGLFHTLFGKRFDRRFGRSCIVYSCKCMFAINGSVNLLAKTFVVIEKQTNIMDYEWPCEKQQLVCFTFFAGFAN